MRSMEFVITWVRKKAKHGFVHYVCDKLKQGMPIRSLLLATGKGVSYLMPLPSVSSLLLSLLSLAFGNGRV
ncbi:MAG: hypothetical protein WAM14_03540 [Candidatus Nitrosopolaris sp.]